MAQANAAGLRGRIVDETGGALPGVTVTAANHDTGLSRDAVTDRDGVYRFVGLPPGTYSLNAELSGFSSVSVKAITLNVAVERELNLTLKPAAMKEQITVTVDAPLIATSPSIGTTVSQQELENLPLNGRQFANLGSLAPGTSLSYNPDPTKPGQQTIAVNGGIGRNVNYLIDGGDNMDDTIGGALQNFNLEAVQEFTIQTQQYKAEYGRSSGGVLTVVTKSGTNDFAGSVYDFYRDKSLNSIRESERRAGAGKGAYERKQYGASLGGPIVRDHAHFFGTYEKTTRPGSYVVNTRGLFPEFDGKSFPLPVTDELRTGKITVNLTSAQLMQVRYGYQKNADKYGPAAGVTPSALGTLTNEYKSILAGHNWVLGGSKFNEFLFQYTTFFNSILPDSEDPSITYPNGVTIGQNFNTPQTTKQEKNQFKDDFSWSMVLGGRRNDFKAGVNYIHEPILSTTFTTGTSGSFEMLNNSTTSPVRRISFNGGFSGASLPIDQQSVYFQDDLAWSNRLTINAGLRYDVWTGFDLDQSKNAIFLALKNNTTYSDASYYADFRNWDGKLSNDTNNFSPRLGFTYDLQGTGKRVLRGGIGRYYDFPYTNATILFPGIAAQSAFGTVYENQNATGIKNSDGTFYRPGQPLPPNQITNPGVGAPNEIGHPSVTDVPYSDQISLGYSTEINSQFGVNIDAVSIRFKDVPFRFRANGRLAANGAPQSARRFSQFGNFRMWMGGGSAKYDGLNVGVRARLMSKFSLQGFYTISRARGNILAGADEFRITDRFYQPDLRATGDQSINFRNPFCDACFGPLNTDARHRITLSGVYSAPWGINLSSILRYHSATPYWDRAGRDVDGDGFLNDLNTGASNVNSKRGSSFSQMDFRASKDFRFGRSFGLEGIFEVFNIFNSKNPAAYSFDANTAATYGQPTLWAGDPLQGENRLIQLGARFRF
jgi:hypothetical protein